MLPAQIETILSNEIDPGFAKRARKIFAIVAENKPATVLDAGCGRGFYVHGLRSFPFIKEIHGIDLKPQYLQRAKHDRDARLNLHIGSVYELPFKNSTFDLVICSEVLEHLEHDLNAVKEIYRVLKPGGTAVFSVPHQNFPFLWDPLNWMLMKLFNTHVSKDVWWLAGIWADHLRLYTPQTFQKAITSQKFKVQELESYIHYCWPFSHFVLYGIGKNIVERLNVKSVDRFSSQKSPVAQLLGRLMTFPSQFDPPTKDMAKKTSINLLIVAVKG